MSAFDTQVGGDHYVQMGIQPLEQTFLNYGLIGLEAAVYTKINKYMTRNKGDHVENLEKARHCLDVLIEKSKLGVENQLPAEVSTNKIPEGFTLHNGDSKCPIRNGTYVDVYLVHSQGGGLLKSVGANVLDWTTVSSYKIS